MTLTPLAFTPLYDPLTALYPGLSDQWLWLLIPLVVIISVTYKCTRIANLKRLPRDAAVMSAQIVVVMAFAAVLLYFGYYAYVKYAGPLVP
jgi:hypothetical protein